MERLVSGFERTLYATGKVATSNVVVMGRVEGPLADTALRRALTRLQRRHPLLHTHIKLDPRTGRPRHVSVGTKRIQLRTLDHVRRGQLEAGWHNQCEFELNTPLSGDGSPAAPIRVVSLRPPEVGNGTSDGGDHVSDLLITLARHIGDAASGVFLFRDLLALLAGDTDEQERLPERLAIEQLLPKKNKTSSGGLGGWFRQPLQLAVDATIAPSEGHTRFVAKQLKPTETDALLQRCRAEDTTVNGAIAAALASAAAADMEDRGDKRTDVALCCAVNLREHTAKKLGDEVGPYTSNVYFSLRTGKAEPFWQLARDAHDHVGTAIARGEAFGDVRRFGELAPKSLEPSDQLVDQVLKRCPANLSVYNLGRVPLGKSVGPYRVRKLQAAMGLPIGECVRAAVTTHAGWLTFNLLYREGAIAADRADALAERCIQSLRTAAGAG